MKKESIETMCLKKIQEVKNRPDLFKSTPHDYNVHGTKYGECIQCTGQNDKPCHSKYNINTNGK